jgi:hypothetical protein
LSFSPDYIAFGDCVAAETLSGAEWKFPGLPSGSTPGSGGNGDDGGGDPTCPSVNDYVWDKPNRQKRAGSVKKGDKLWNPITWKYAVVNKAEIIPNQQIIRVETANGCISRSSETHKLIIAVCDEIGTKICNLQEKDLVLTYSNSTLELSKIISIRKDDFDDVILLELEDGNRIYCSGSKIGNGLVAHNRKEDIIIGGGILY